TACAPYCAPGPGPRQATQIRAPRGSKGRKNLELSLRFARLACRRPGLAFALTPMSQPLLPLSLQKETSAAGTSWAPPLVASLTHVRLHPCRVLWKGAWALVQKDADC